MKMLKYVDIRLRTSELTTFLTSVPEWELPIIELVHGRSAIERVGEHLRPAQKRRFRNGEWHVTDAAPNGATEFERLSKRYGFSQTEDGGKGPANAVIQYGQFGVGEQNLQRAIDAATVEAKDEPLAHENDDLIGQVSSVGG